MLRQHAVWLCAIFSLIAVGGLYAFTAWKTSSIELKFPPQGQFISVGGTVIHYTRRTPIGSKRGTIVLLHGASGNQADVMLPLGDRLAARGFEVLAPDRPGHGWSGRPSGRLSSSPAEQAFLIRRAFESIGVTTAIMVGHSWSGALALNFALDHGEFTRGVVLIAPVTHPWPGGVAAYYEVAASSVLGQIFTRLFTLPIGLALRDKAIAAVFSPQVPASGYAEQSGADLILRPAEFMANAQDVADLKEFVSTQAPRYPLIRVPVSIVTGDHDAIVLTKVHSFASAREIPGATLHVLQGVGHAPHHADPEAVITAIEEVVAAQNTN